MDYIQQNKILVPRSHINTRAAQGKVGRSFDVGNSSGYNSVSFLGDISPWKYTQLSIEKLVNMPYPKLADILIRTNPDAAFVWATYKYYCNSGHDWVSEEGDDRAVDIMKQFEARSEMSDAEGVSFREQLDETISDLIVKGASFTELYYDDSGSEAMGIARYDPCTAVFVEEDGKTLIGQLKEDKKFLARALTRDDINVMIDPLDPLGSEYFKYERFHVSRSVRRGVGLFEPLISTLLGMSRVMSLSFEYYEGQASPQSMFWVPLTDLLNNEILTSTDEIEAYVQSIAKAAEEAFNSGDASQAVFLEGEVEHELRQGMNRSNLSVADLLFRILERRFERGSGIPGALTGSNENRSEGQGTTEDNSFQIKIESIQNIVESVYSGYAPIITLGSRVLGTAALTLNKLNIEGRRLEAQILETLAKSYKDLIESGVMSAENARSLLKMQNSIYDILEAPDEETPVLDEIMDEEESEDE